MDKLQALVPLLGWFYLSVFGYAVLWWMFPRFRKVLQLLFLGGFGVYAVVLSVQGLVDELRVIPPIKTVAQSFDEKTKFESSEYFATYYQTFQPVLTEHDKVYLRDVSPREFHYARMYLYPAAVEMMMPDPQSPYALVVSQDEHKKRFPNAAVLAQKDDHLLILVTDGDEQ